MRICLISSESVYTDAALHALLGFHEIKITGLVQCTAVAGTQSNWRAYKNLITRSGLLYAGYLGAVTSPALRLPHVPRWQRMGVWANSLRCPFLATNTISAPQTLDFIEGSDADIVLTVHLGQILRDAFYERFSGRTYNIHPGRLPSYRGPDPVFHAIMNKERTFTVSLHESIRRIDAGQVLAEKTIKPEKKTLFRTNLELFRQTGQLVSSQFLGSRDCLPKSEERPAHYFGWPTTGETLKFLATGNRL